MHKRFKSIPQTDTGDRVKDVNILLPQIIPGFFVRLYSYFENYPEPSFEGYEFYVKDVESGLEFSAGLTGFGPGYFCKDPSKNALEIIEIFHEQLFDPQLVLKECEYVFETDFGKTTIGFKDGKLIEIYEDTEE